MKLNFVALLAVGSLLFAACGTTGLGFTGGVTELAWQQALEIPGFEGAELDVAHIGDDVVIVVGTHEPDIESRHLYAALERDSGELRWSVDLGVNTGSKLSSFHALRQEVFVVGSHQSKTVQAFDVATGDVRWDLDNAEHPEIRGDYLVIGGWNDQGATYNADTGELLFVGQLKYQVANEFALLDSDANSYIRLVDLPSGDLIWETPERLLSVFQVDRSTPLWIVEPSPDAPVAAFRDSRGQVVGVDLETGQIVWTKSLARSEAVVSPDGKYVAIQKSGAESRNDVEMGVEMVEVATGETVWSATIPGFYLNPVMTGEVLVATTGPVQSFIPNPDIGGDFEDVEALANEVSGYDVASGEKLWSVEGLEGPRVRLSSATRPDDPDQAALLLIQAGSDLEQPAVTEVQLLDLYNGEPIGNAIPAEFGERNRLSSGIALAGQTGVYIDKDRIRLLDGTDIGAIAGTYKSATVENGAIAVWSNDEATAAPTTITFFEAGDSRTN